MHQFKADMVSEHILQLRKISLSHMYFLDMFEMLNHLFPENIRKCFQHISKIYCKNEKDSNIIT